jgi:hypothetical protein
MLEFALGLVHMNSESSRRFLKSKTPESRKQRRGIFGLDSACCIFDLSISSNWLRVAIARSCEGARSTVAVIERLSSYGKDWAIEACRSSSVGGPIVKSLSLHDEKKDKISGINQMSSSLPE